MIYYNDNEPFVCEWMRRLICANQIGYGIVDERPIQDIKSEDLAGFTRCHFFAGIAGWELALNLAGFPADVDVWTGSCPCQPFSAAGKRLGRHDDRNLWHIWFELIRVCKPSVVIGEQVEAAIRLGWLDRVLDDLEAEGYQTWACVLPACCAGAPGFHAPHIRARLFWVAHRISPQLQAEGSRSTKSQTARMQGKDWQRERLRNDSGECSPDGRLAHAEDSDGWTGESEQEAGVGSYGRRGYSGSGADSRLANDDGTGRGRPQLHLSEREPRQAVPDAMRTGPDGRVGDSACKYEQEQWRPEQSGQTRAGSGRSSPWRDSVWLPCSDGKWRRTGLEPEVRMLADGVPADVDGLRSKVISPLAEKSPGRVGCLRGLGNAISVPVAAEFVKAWLDCQ